MRKKYQSLIRYISVTALFYLSIVSPSHAATPNIVSGAQRLAQDALTWVLILVPVTAGTMVGYHAWMKSMADGEPGAVAERNKKIKQTLIGGVVAESAAGITQLILSYF